MITNILLSATLGIILYILEVITLKYIIGIDINPDTSITQLLFYFQIVTIFAVSTKVDKKHEKI